MGNSEEAAYEAMRELLDLGTESVSVERTPPQKYEEEEEASVFTGVSTVYCKELIQFTFASEDPHVLTHVGLPEARTFSVRDSRGVTRGFEWVDQAKVKALQTAMSDPEAESRLVPAPIGPSLKDLRAYMQSPKIDIGPTGPRGLEDLYAETRKGDASLIQGPDGEITHVVDVVVFQLVDRKSGRILVETEQTLANGTKNKGANLPSAKRRADENHFFTAWRIIGEQMMLDAHMVKINEMDVQYFEEQKDSSKFPGLLTVSRRCLMKGELVF